MSARNVGVLLLLSLCGGTAAGVAYYAVARLNQADAAASHAAPVSAPAAASAPVSAFNPLALHCSASRTGRTFKCEGATWHLVCEDRDGGSLCHTTDRATGRDVWQDCVLTSGNDILCGPSARTAF